MAWLYLLIFLQIFPPRSGKQGELYQKFLENPEQYKFAYYGLRLEFIQKREFDKLLEISKKGMKNFPEEYIFYSDYGLALWESGKRKEFDEFTYTLISQFTEIRSIQQVLYIWINHKAHNAALYLIDKIREKEENPVLAGVAYRIYLIKKDYQNAMQELLNTRNFPFIKGELSRLARNISFEDIEKIVMKIEEPERYYPLLASFALQQGKRKTAMKYYLLSGKEEEFVEKILQEDPNFFIEVVKDIKKTPKVMFLTGMAYESLLDTNKAIEIYENIVDLKTDMSQKAGNRLARIFIARGDFKRAEHYISSIPEEGGDILKAELFLHQGKLQEAKKYLEEKETESALYLFARTQYFSLNFASAETLFFKYIERFPQDDKIPDALFYAYLLLNFKSLAEFKEYVDTEYALFKDEEISLTPPDTGKLSSLYSFLYALYLSKKREKNQAGSLLKKIGENQETLEIIRVRALYEFAKILEEEGRKEEAEEVYRKILVQFPETPLFPFVQERLEKL